MKLVRILLAAALLVPAIALAQHTSFDEALADAKSEEKLVLIDFYTDWCGPCKVFTKETAEDADVKSMVSSFVLCKIDAEKGDGVAIAKEFSVRSYPNFVVVNGDRMVTDRWAGYAKEMFLAEAGDALADPTTIEQKAERQEKNPNVKDAITLAGYHMARDEYEPALGYYKSAASVNPSTSYTSDIFRCTYYGHRTKKFDDKALTQAADPIFASKETSPGELLMSAQMIRASFTNPKNQALAVPYVKAAVERTEGIEDPSVVNARAQILPDYALLVLEDPSKAVEYKKASYPEGWLEDANALNGFAWWCFESDVNLEEAQELALKGVALSQPGADRANILDTVAEICNALGNCDQAIAYIDQAIGDAPEREYFKKQKERFEKLLAEKQSKSD